MSKRKVTQVEGVYVKNTHYSGNTCVGTKIDHLQILRLKKVEKEYAGDIPVTTAYIILN